MAAPVRREESRGAEPSVEAVGPDRIEEMRLFPDSFETGTGAPPRGDRTRHGSGRRACARRSVNRDWSPRPSARRYRRWRKSARERFPFFAAELRYLQIFRANSQDDTFADKLVRCRTIGWGESHLDRPPFDIAKTYLVTVCF
jgi:hypothetical protein